MRYFLEYKEDRLVSWIVKETAPVTLKEYTEVNSTKFKEELLKVGVTYETIEDKINQNEQAIMELSMLIGGVI